MGKTGIIGRLGKLHLKCNKRSLFWRFFIRKLTKNHQENSGKLTPWASRKCPLTASMISSFVPSDTPRTGLAGMSPNGIGRTPRGAAVEPNSPFSAPNWWGGVDQVASRDGAGGTVIARDGAGEVGVDLQHLSRPLPVLGPAAGGVLGELGPRVALRRPFVLECVLDARFEGGRDVAHGRAEIPHGVPKTAERLDDLAVVVLDCHVHEGILLLRDGCGVET